jgi:hypothetical protein
MKSRTRRCRAGFALSGIVALGGALTGCGGEPASSAGQMPSGDGLDDGSEAAPGVEVTRFTVEGRGESGKTSTVLEVVEGEGVTLAITGADAADNLIVISAGFDDVAGVVGFHRLPIGVIDVDQVFAVGSVDGQLYHSLSGELEVTMSSDRHAQGRFDMTLGVEESLTASLQLSGTFESQWMLTCYSYLRGFTGDHFVTDSPYCNSLTF